MTIKKLPQYLINQLKAGEIVERPASIVKELIENSIDAGATSLQIELVDGGKERIIVRDNGSGVQQDDLLLMIERYATSKIHEADDLLALISYGFRGEALSAIAEVSSFCVQSKIANADTGYELKKFGSEYRVTPVAFGGMHGTHVIVDQLFSHIPVREKYLKSQATEWKYIRQLIMTYALVHYDKEWTLIHNGKPSLTLSAHDSVAQRAGFLFQESRENKQASFEYKDEHVHCWGLRGDASLHFPTSQYIYCIVNGRPVTDKLIRKAILTAYRRQIVPGSYPFVILFLDIDPSLVDVNVHPRKMEVTFLDPGSIFNLVKQTVEGSLEDQKVSYSAFTNSPVQKNYSNKRSVGEKQGERILTGMKDFSSKDTSRAPSQTTLLSQEFMTKELSDSTLYLGEHAIRILGQLNAMYIVAQCNQGMMLIDQHALAERVAFEKMRKNVKERGFESEILLTPLTLHWSLDNEQQSLLNSIGFDVAQLTAKSSVVYAVPLIFQQYSIDLPLLFQCIEGIDMEENYDAYAIFGLILDEIMGMKACKASIKAGERLSLEQMERLIRDASGMIDGLFVCQHGRPSVVLIKNKDIDGLFDRH